MKVFYLIIGLLVFCADVFNFGGINIILRLYCGAIIGWLFGEVVILKKRD